MDPFPNDTTSCCNNNAVSCRTTVTARGSGSGSGSVDEGIAIEVLVEKEATAGVGARRNATEEEQQKQEEEEEEEESIGLQLQCSEESADTISNSSTCHGSPPLISHFKRPDLHAGWRYGIPLYLLSTIALLLAADIGSGIQAILVTIPSPVDRWSTRTEDIVADESIFTSVRHLWQTESYPLAIFLVITSIAWPYIKLLVTLYAWMVPPSNKNNTSNNVNGLVKRERLLEVLDVLGKWSFADVFVFCKILVAFRATIPAGGGAIIEVYMLARWGFYGFVLATILSLIGTHVILYHHRQFLYNNNNNNNNCTSHSSNNNNNNNNLHDTTTSNIRPMERIFLLIAIFTGLAAYLYGCTADLFQVSRQRGSIETLYDDYSIISVGTAYVDSTKYANAGDRWIQCLWFILAVVMPILSAILMALLLVIPNHNNHPNHYHPIWQRCVFTMAEIAFAWNGGEVIVLSALFAVLQIPSFGDGIMDSGCDVCYVIGSELYLETLVPLLIGAFINMASAFWIYRRWHPVLFVVIAVGCDNDNDGSGSAGDRTKANNNNNSTEDADADDGGSIREEGGGNTSAA